MKPKLNKQNNQCGFCGVTALPVYFLLHVGGVAATIVAQQEATVTQSVDVYFNVGVIHYDYISRWGLASHLKTVVFNYIFNN